MRRLPIRLRLTLAFAVAMALVLAATGALLHLRLGASLDEAIDEELAARAGEAAAAVARGAPVASASLDPEERFVQVLGPDGRVVQATAGVDGQAVLGSDELARVAAGRQVRLERRVAGLDGRARVLATPGRSEGQRPVAVVVGASLGERDEALAGLLAELLVVLPGALALSSLLAWALAGAALRPVEALRAEAAGISASDPGRRLTAPRARDELSRLAETLNDMLARLEEALVRERRFVADASHELRTPLALLKAELELALRRARSAGELEQAVRSAAAETDRLAELAEDLLVLARADAESLPLRRELVPAQRLLSRVAERFRGRAEAGGRRIVVEAPEGIAVAADVPRLEQAVGNLVANALRHGEGEIRLRAGSRDGRVELHVLDEGPGFPPDFLPRAWDRFTRADAARSGSGAGLGLAIAETVARAHGGAAGARNRPEGGADVWLSLPATAP